MWIPANSFDPAKHPREVVVAYRIPNSTKIEWSLGRYYPHSKKLKSTQVYSEHTVIAFVVIDTNKIHNTLSDEEVNSYFEEYVNRRIREISFKPDKD